MLSSLQICQTAEQYGKGYINMKWMLNADKGVKVPVIIQFNVSKADTPVHICSLQRAHGKLHPDNVDFGPHIEEHEPYKEKTALVKLDGVEVELIPELGSCYLVSKSVKPGVHKISVLPLTNKRIAITDLIWQ
eukprot:TRINITY_DN4887_c0_g1_i1.p1 TRINITY_DN4887_c0_g1~~TRINITY_DN4887_c0_g1_i1.p1  ORF type:complete len:133 (-),score=28.53 TRINITY_DN4887_c0_g1_i1:45-443(-)